MFVNHNSNRTKDNKYFIHSFIHSFIWNRKWVLYTLFDGQNIFFFHTVFLILDGVYFDQLLSAARTQRWLKLKNNSLRELTSFCMSTSFEEKTKSHFFFIFKCFLLISTVKSLKKLWNEQKRLTNGWKIFLTSFWVWAAPKRLSKYTTLRS